VLVFPSCNEPGLEIVRSLIDQEDIEVHGGSSLPIHEDASATILSKHIHFPMVDDPSFQSIFSGYIRKQKIDVIFPSMEIMVTEFSKWSIEGARFVVPRPELASIVESKKKTYTLLKGVVPLPQVIESAPYDFPLYAKPVDGSGGRDHIIVQNEVDFSMVRNKKHFITEYLPGGEIVAYNLNDLDGKHILCITKTMGRWKGGASQLGELKADPVVHGYARAISNKMRPIGPWFAQFKKDRNGIYKLMEVNARLGGASGICRFAGVNIPLLTARLFAGHPITIPKICDGISWVRNLKAYPTMDSYEQVFWDLSAFCRSGSDKLRPHAVAALFELSNIDIKQFCYGERFPEALCNWCLEKHFSCKYNSLMEAIDKVSAAEKTVFITNNNTDHTQINELNHNIRVVSTSALSLLGKEKL
jgi:hypothetical protein